MDVIGTCALCGKDRRLLKSHIIPRLMIRWIRGKRRMRFRLAAWADTASVYERQRKIVKNLQQDGPKIPLFCFDCEGRLSRLESDFSNQILHKLPVMANLVLPYSDFLHKYCASLMFRAVLFCRYTGQPLPEWDRSVAAWRDYLMDKPADCHAYELHLVALGPDRFGGDIPIGLPKDWESLIRKGMQISFGSSKIPIGIVRVRNLIFVALANKNPAPDAWRIHQIHNNGGEIVGGIAQIPKPIFDIIMKPFLDALRP